MCRLHLFEGPFTATLPPLEPPRACEKPLVVTNIALEDTDIKKYHIKHYASIKQRIFRE
jgi:hypothetical protein